MKPRSEIFHIVRDDKFIDGAFREFEFIKPGKNRFLIIGKAHPLRYVKETPITFCNLGEAKKLINNQNCAAVILHSLVARALIASIPPHKTVIWIGWGYDYYDRLLSKLYPDGLLLPRSKDLVERQAKIEKIGEGLVGFLLRAATQVLQLVYCLRFGIKDKRLLSRIDYFSPVLNVEYELAKNLNPWFHPRYAEWNYGVLEDDADWESNWSREPGKNILIGNSAAPENNHLEVFELLDRSVDLTGRKIIVPLSYGESWYKEKIIEAGSAMFGDKFVPLVDFMARDNYIELLRTCGFVFMNHLRQQGLGNIRITLAEGARIYLHKKNPAYQWFLDKGAFIDSIQSLRNSESGGKVTLVPLSKRHRESNSKAIMDHWARARQHERTRALIDIALGKLAKS